MRRGSWLLGWLAVCALVALSAPAQAGMFGYSRQLKPQLERIKFEASVLPPMSHSLFCVRYPQDCEVKKMAFRGHKFELTPQRWADLMEVNAGVNRGIAPERNLLGLAGEKWLISPARGDCNDYAVTKRHDLLARGWPSRALLLAEVVVPDGEHHLVVVIRSAQGDFVLDNLTGAIKPWSKAPYRWVRVQTPSNPKWWAAITSVNV
jgi:predicted transglutaminase-like cysteine proteinase